VKALVAICTLGLSIYATALASAELGSLTNYYHDCPASRGPHAGYLRKVITRALRGDEAAMHSVIMHKGIFSTGDNEGYSEVPRVLLRTLGDDRYADFVTRQSRDVQELALALYPKQDAVFERKFLKTAKLYREQYSR
jgi:hypothetical protein